LPAAVNPPPPVPISLSRYGIDSVEDLRLADEDDLRDAGITKTFQRRKLLKAIRALEEAGEGEGAGRAATLAEVLRLMQTGDRRMQDADCEAARTSYVEAMSVARAGKFADVVTIVEWKLYKAQSCLGSAVLPLPGPEVKDPTCGIKALKDEELLADFEKAASKGGERRVKNWGRWFKLFGVSKHSCSKRDLSRGYRKLMLKYVERRNEERGVLNVIRRTRTCAISRLTHTHLLSLRYHPDKFRGGQHCAVTMSLIVNAGKELLDGHRACGGSNGGHGEL
jgi:hypothetical protein